MQVGDAHHDRLRSHERSVVPPRAAGVDRPAVRAVPGFARTGSLRACAGDRCSARPGRLAGSAKRDRQPEQGIRQQIVRRLPRSSRRGESMRRSATSRQAKPWQIVARTLADSLDRRCRAVPPSRDQAIVPTPPQNEASPGLYSQRPGSAGSRGTTARRTRFGKPLRLDYAALPKQGRRSDPRCRRIEPRHVLRIRRRNGADTRAELIGRRAVDTRPRSSRAGRSTAAVSLPNG